MAIPKTSTLPTKINRLYKGDVTIDHDLFKLEVAEFKKNIAFEEGVETLVSLEHCHLYHTFDSRGKKMDECNAVGGHKHKVTVEADAAGNMTAKVGPAFGGSKSDNHTHKASYIRSERIGVKQISAEAMKVFAAYDSPVISKE